MKMKGKDGMEYTGEEKGGVFAIWDKDKKNVGNFKNREDAIKLGGYTVMEEAAATPPVDQKTQTGTPPVDQKDKPGTDSSPQTGSDKQAGEKVSA